VASSLLTVSSRIIFSPPIHTSRSDETNTSTVPVLPACCIDAPPTLGLKAANPSAGSMVHALHFGQNLLPSFMPTLCVWEHFAFAEQMLGPK
jgi:hypothetical protein